MVAERPRGKIKSDQQQQPSLRKRAVNVNVPQKQCAPCHLSCLRCRGPSNHECTECVNSSAYREMAPNETYCDAASDRDGSLKVIKLFNNDHSTNDTQNYFSHKSFLQILYDGFPSYIMIILYIALVTTVLIVARYLYAAFITSKNTSDKKNYVYNRIAYDGGNDHIIMEQEMMMNTSDSSEEIEMNK